MRISLGNFFVCNFCKKGIVFRKDYIGKKISLKEGLIVFQIGKSIIFKTKYERIFLMIAYKILQ